MPGKRTVVDLQYPALAQALGGRDEEPTVHDAATAAVEGKNGGSPVDAGVAGQVEAHLGADFSNVRVHQDPLAQQATQAMGARAFAYGGDVFLGRGESGSDLALMAHELTHVAQQGATGQRVPQRQVQVGEANSPAEAQADAVAGAVTGGQARPAQLLVDDGPVQPGQMLKSTFIQQLRSLVTAAADEELGPIDSAIGCPYIDRYFSRYTSEPAAHGEAMLRRYAPATRGAKTAAEMIPLVVERVRAGVRTWRETGQAPADLVAAEPAAAAAPDGAPAVQAKVADRSELSLHNPEATLARLGDGAPLDSTTNARLGDAMGDNFSDVRVHTDAGAGALAGQMNALAFTVGSHVAFAPGQYAPGTPEGDALLAHELTHVQQQRAAQPGAQSKDASGTHADAAEEDADQGAMSALVRLYNGAKTGAAAMMGRAGNAMKTGLSLRRCPNEKKARPVAEKTEDYALNFGQHDFIVSFELLPGTGPGQIRVVMQPVNWERVYQSEMKYWDFKGREVGPDDSYTTMGKHSVPAVPTEKTITIPDRTKFRGAFPKPAKAGKESVYEIDIDGDGKADFDLHCSLNKDKIFTSYDFKLFAGGTKTEFNYHYIADDAWKHGYSGNRSPRREPDDFFDSLKTVVDIGVGFIPVIGEIVDLAEAITGYTKFGDKMSPAERAVTGLAVLIPFAGGALLRKVAKGGMTLAEAALKMGKSEDDVIAALKAIDNRQGDHAMIEALQAELKAGKELTETQLRNLDRVLHQVDAEKRTFRAIEQQAGVEGVMRRGGKIAAETAPVSIKQLRITLGRAGVSPSPYHLRKASAADLKALTEAGDDPVRIYAWVSRDGTGKAITDHRGRPIITFTEKGLSSLQEAVTSFGHEVQHLKDFAAGRGTTEAGAEKAGEQLWELVKKSRE